jgi:hypothetical protein
VEWRRNGDQLTKVGNRRPAATGTRRLIIHSIAVISLFDLNQLLLINEGEMLLLFTRSHCQYHYFTNYIRGIADVQQTIRPGMEVECYDNLPPIPPSSADSRAICISVDFHLKSSSFK